MDRLAAMKVFIQVADRGGFAGAARQLNMSPPAVTRAVAALEEAIGTRLLSRTTRSVKLTEAGARYLDDCRRILGDLDEAEAAASGAATTATGLLTVTAPVHFGRIYVLPIITEFLALQPKVNVRALFVDRVLNLLEEGADLGVRIAELKDSGLMAVRVGAVRRVVCAAPDYLARHPPVRTPADLRDHAVIGSTSLAMAPEWRFGQEEAMSVTVRPRLVCSTVDSALAAALAGQGIVRLLSYQVAPAVAEGSLAILLEDYEPRPAPIHIVHVGGRRTPAKVRAFIDLAVDRLRANPMIA